MENDFIYSGKEINKIIEESNLQKALMKGVIDDLIKLKPIIEKLYHNEIFYLNYWASECTYFGYDWSKDDGSMKSQYEITNGITQKFREIYALILAGLGEKCEEHEQDIPSYLLEEC